MKGRSPVVVNLPEGARYYVRDRPSPAGTRPVIRYVANDSEILSEELFAPHRGGWVRTAAITIYHVGMSEDEWTEISEEEANGYIDHAASWWEDEKKS